MKLEVVLEVPYLLRHPVVTADHQLVASCASSGSIVSVDLLSKAVSTKGQVDGNPSGIALDESSQAGVLCDAEQRAVFALEANGGDQFSASPLISQFEGRPLVGPNHVVMTADGEIVFTDGAESSLSNPCGSVYRTVQQRTQLVRLCGPGLANPAGLALAANGAAIFVAESASNRVLRFVKRGDGHYDGNVWAQLTGGAGPRSIAVHPETKDVYVAKYEYRGLGVGSVMVFGEDGSEKGVLTVPEPQIQGICFSSDNALLLVSEVENGSVIYQYR